MNTYAADRALQTLYDLQAQQLDRFSQIVAQVTTTADVNLARSQERSTFAQIPLNFVALTVRPFVATKKRNQSATSS